MKSIPALKLLLRGTMSCSLLITLLSLHTIAQVINRSTRDDTLRGALNPLKTCYDVTFYDLSVAVDVKKRSISGSSMMRFKIVSDFDSIQIDLFRQMKIEKILFNSTELSYRRDVNSVFVQFPQRQLHGNEGEISVSFSGIPPVAKNPPWDGGFVWKKDREGRDWVGLACEGLGASSWFPCKDHLSDEPDSMRMNYIVPTGLVCSANGKLQDSIDNLNGTTTWKWMVTYPINLYNVTLNLGHYKHFSDSYAYANSKLSLDYYVLDYNYSQAVLHFQQVKTMLSCFEKFFGSYPFYCDGYKLIETPYWGMEHQSAISYGNEYVNNREGFDFIIIHESAHEWWGNNVSADDYADLWIHEAFATYAEALYVECTKSYDEALTYLNNIRWEIRDTFPIVGPRGINFDGSALDNDMYFKGAWIIHTFRNVLQNDSLFFRIVKGLQLEYALETISTKDVVSYINQSTGKDYAAFFQQYLYFPDPPVLEYTTRQKGKDTELTYRWKTNVQSFNMPLEIVSFYDYSYGKITRAFTRVNATSEWQKITLKNFEEKNVDVNNAKFYIKMEKVK